MSKSRLKKTVARIMSIVLILAGMPQMYKNVKADTKASKSDAVKMVCLNENGVTAAVTEGGDLYCWGNNENGQVGNGTTTSQLTPIKILSNIRSVSLVKKRSAAITENGDLYCWGNNENGQVGNGTTTNQLTPVKVLSNVKSVSLEWDTSAAITENGDLYCWGNNENGQIGYGTEIEQLTPAKVLSNVRSVNLGDNCRNAAITEDGDLYCWGFNYYGGVGNGTTENQYTPVKVLSNVKSVSLEGDTSAAITENRDLYCWGFNYFGNVGNGTTINQLTPVKILSDIRNVSLGGGTSAAITENGDLYCWGSNSYGSVGDGTGIDQSIPVKILRNVKSVSLRGHRNAAVTEEGDLYCWGFNCGGVVNGTTEVCQLTPVKVLSNVRSNIRSDGPVYERSTAITENGDLYCWGFNYRGGVGNGTTIHQYKPVKVLSNIRSVSLEGDTSAAVTEDGDLYCWGYNEYGQVGNGTTTNQLTPILISLNGESDTTEDQDVYKGSSDSNNTDFKLGSKTEFIIPSEVPIIGGGKVGLDFENVPVQFNREGNKFQIGVGVKDLKDLHDNEWTTFKKFVDTQKEEYKKGINNLLDAKCGTASMGWSVKPKISCYGYAEGTITSNGIQSVGGKIAIEISAKASKEWQTIVVVVPVVIKSSGEVGVKANVALGADFSKQSVYFNGDLDLTIPKIKLSGGVGVAYICDVSVYGQASNNVKFAFDGNVSASLTGKLGVSAKILCFSYEKVLLKGTWDYYKYSTSKSKARNSVNTARKSSPDNNTMSIKADDTNATKWNPSSLTKAISSDDGVTLQKDIYDAAKPKILKTDNGKTIITYIEAVNNRSEGNQYAVVYSVYDEVTGKWSAPTVVDDDGTADFNLETVANGNNIYFVWSNLKERITVEEIESLDSESVASKCEIEYAKLNTDTMKISGSNVITSNNNLDTITGAYVNDGKVYVGWVENSNNDILNLSGTNKIHLGEIVGDKYVEKQTKSVSNPVKQVSIGKLGDNVELAYIEKDNDENSLNTMDISGKINNIKSISGNIENATFSKIDNSDSLLWYSNENSISTINCLNSEQMSISKLIEDDRVNSDFYIVNDGKRDILLSSANEESSNSQAIGYVMGQGRGYVELLNSKNKIGNISAVYSDGKYMLLYTDTVANVGENNVETATDLKIKSVQENSFVKIESVDYLAEDIMPENEMTITAKIKNDGLLSEKDDISLVAYYDNNEIGRKTVNNIQFGEEKDVDIDVELPQNLYKDSNIIIKALKQNKVQDTYNETISQSDLELSVSESDKSVTVKVSNIGAFETEATLYLYDKDEKGTVLDKYNCGTLQSGESYNVNLDLNKYINQNIENIMFVVKSNDEEVFQYNNSYSIYIGKNTLKDIDYIQASKTKTEYTAGDQLDVSDITVEAVYKDGSKENKENYETNAKTIDMSTAGTKTLTVEYEEVGEKRTVDIPIEVKRNPNVATSTTEAPTTVATTTEVDTGKINKPALEETSSESIKTTTKGSSELIADTPANKNKKTNAIKPKAVKKLTAKNSKKKCISLKWKKVSKSNGYEIQYALDKKYKRDKRKKSTYKLSYMIKKLKKNRTYYVRVRAYVICNGKKVNGSWSRTKKVGIKK